ncbi:MAG: hypothetical protein NVS2B6_12320 [Thermoleophilaceae bacterium]
MIALARALVRLVSFVLLLALATSGLAIAVFSIEGGKTGLSAQGLAKLVHLPQLRQTVAHFLHALEAGGSIALVALAAGLGAILLGLVLLVGVVVPRRERLLELSNDGAGRISARRRPLAQVARALIEPAKGLTEASVSVRPRRSSGGRVRVSAAHTRSARPADVEGEARRRLEGLTGEFKLRARIRTHPASGSGRAD